MMQDIKQLIDLNGLRKQSAEIALAKLNSTITELETQLTEVASETLTAQMIVYHENVLEVSGLICVNLKGYLGALGQKTNALQSEILRLQSQKNEHEAALRATLASENYLGIQLRHQIQTQEKKRELADSETLTQLHNYSLRMQRF
jgi:hypothetical protein